MSACNSGHPTRARQYLTTSNLHLPPHLSITRIAMSFNQLNTLEAQPDSPDGHRSSMRREDDPQYRDDPAFDRLTEELSNQLFTLTSNISRLSSQIALLGTKRDNERVRERVHDLLESSRSGFKDVGDGLKKVQAWEDVNVGSCVLVNWDNC